jgi:hypothetical protein
MTSTAVPPHPAQYLHHEHLVRINDPANAGSAWLSRKQLWEGLRYTVLLPQSLDPSIDAANVQHNSDGTLQRTIRRGSITSVDVVELQAEISLTIRANASSMFAGSTLTIRIEEPAPQILFVRFIYQLQGLEPGRTEEEDCARRDAYQASDIERVREARRYSLAVKN